MSLPVRIQIVMTALLTVLFLSPGSLFAVPLSKVQIFQVATLAARDGEYQKAAELFKKVLEVDPRFAPAYNSLGMVYQAMAGESGSSEAKRYYELAVEVDPVFIEALNNLGRAYYASGQFVQAEQAMVKSLELRPDQADIQLVTAWVFLLGESRAEQAIKHFELGLAAVDDDMAHYGIGLAHLLLEEKFKVLDQITELRRRHKDELATRLENMVRGNVKISSTPGSPLVTGVDPGPSVFDKELKDLSANGFKAGKDDKDIRVRLKGPLVD